jgi:hypothetical protein
MESCTVRPTASRRWKVIGILDRVSWCVRVLGLCACLLFVATADAEAGASSSCPADSAKFARIDVTITGDAIQVNPESQTIYLDKQPKRICWVVSNLGENRTLHIKGKDPTDKALSQRKIKSPKTFANSGYPSGKLVVAPGEQHRWRYKLEVTKTGDDTPILSLDPEIIIVKKPSGRG